MGSDPIRRSRLHKKILGLASAVAALLPAGMARADTILDTNSVPKAQSFAELLAPIPNAVDKLQASDAVLAERDADAVKVEMAQYYYHHHHHHHRFFRPFFHHHHHHHFYRRYHHHHHHHYYDY